MKKESSPSNQFNKNTANSVRNKPALVLVKGRMILDTEELAQYAGEENCLIPLHPFDYIDRFGRPRGKSPQDKDWCNRDYSDFNPTEHMLAGGNVGYRIPETRLVVDVDPKNFKGENSLEKLMSATGFNYVNYPYVDTGSGGVHIYFEIDAGENLGETHPDYPGIEFKTKGRQVVAAGSRHPNGLTYAFSILTPLLEISKAPEKLLQVFRRSVKTHVNPDFGRHTPEQLEKMLEGLDPCDYREHDKWLPLMMSCHYATGGNGAEEFIDWSTSDPEYADHRNIILRRWDSLQMDKSSSVTHLTLYKALNDKNKGALIPPATTAEDDFADEPFDESEGEEDRDFIITPELRNLCKMWVWVADPLCFIHRKTLKKYDRQQWESLHAHLGPKKGSIVLAVWKGKIPFKRFESLVYLPDVGEFPDGPKGKRYNIWRPSEIEAIEGDVSWFISHMEYMFPDEDDREIVLDYLALLVRSPSIKINFALLIRGTQGIGKSAIGLLMRKIIGDGNTVEPNNDALASHFTDWQEAKILAIIHEMMMRGRLDVANHLKPVITDDRLRVEAKYLRPYTIENHLNLLCFTNHSDAVHLEAEDRRWCVVHSPAAPRDNAYYAMLFSHINSAEGPAAVKFFLQERITKIDPKGRAPVTKAKEDMRELSMSDAEHFLLERLEANAYPFDFDLVRFEDVVGALRNAVQEREISCKSPRLAATKFLKSHAIQPSHNKKAYSEEGMNCRLWIIRNQFHWQEVGPTARAEAYNNRHKK